MRVNPPYNNVKKLYSFEGCVFTLFCTICAFMTELPFISVTHLVLLIFLLSSSLLLKKSVIVKNKSMKNEQ